MANIPTRKVKMFHIGRKVPKGFKELPGSIHLGKGIWLLKMELIKESKNEK